GRQHRPHRHQRFRPSRRRVGYAQTELEQRRASNESTVNQRACLGDMSEFEAFEFGGDADVTNLACHLPDVRREAHKDLLTEIHRADIQRTNVWAEVDDMPQAPFRVRQIGARTTDLRVIGAGHIASAPSGGQIDQHIAAAVADAPNDLSKQFKFTRMLSRFGVAYMDMDNRS